MQFLTYNMLSSWLSLLKMFFVYSEQHGTYREYRMHQTSGCLQEVKNIIEYFKEMFLQKVVVVAYKRSQVLRSSIKIHDSNVTGKILVFWIGGCILGVVTHGGSTVACVAGARKCSRQDTHAFFLVPIYFLAPATQASSTVALNELCFDLNRKFISVVAANRHNNYGSWETIDN